MIIDTYISLERDTRIVAKQKDTQNDFERDYRQNFKKEKDNCVDSKKERMGRWYTPIQIGKDQIKSKKIEVKKVYWNYSGFKRNEV